MATKTITIMEDAYKALLANKMKNESFSDVIRRTFKKKKDIREFEGVWKDSDEETMEENIIKLREKSTKELIKKYKR